MQRDCPRYEDHSQSLSEILRTEENTHITTSYPPKKSLPHSPAGIKSGVLEVLENRTSYEADCLKLEKDMSEKLEALSQDVQKSAKECRSILVSEVGLKPTVVLPPWIPQTPVAVALRNDVES